MLEHATTGGSGAVHVDCYLTSRMMLCMTPLSDVKRMTYIKNCLHSVLIYKRSMKSDSYLSIVV